MIIYADDDDDDVGVVFKVLEEGGGISRTTRWSMRNCAVVAVSGGGKPFTRLAVPDESNNSLISGAWDQWVPRAGIRVPSFVVVS